MKTIHHVVDINAPDDTVWTALTGPAGLAGWWSTKVSSPAAAVGAQVHWTFDGDFNPVMEITTLRGRELGWRCISGHQPWQDSTFRFALKALERTDGLLVPEDRRTRLRFWQEYAVELDDDYYGIYNFNWGYYLESLRLYRTTGAGKALPARRLRRSPPMRITNLTNEPADHTARREELRLAEIALTSQRERVAELRRRLPAGPIIENYVFEEGPADLAAGDAPVRRVRLNELFTDHDRALVVYHLMYGKRQTQPCPMCTMWIDGFHGVAHHLAQNVAFAIVAAADPATLRGHGRSRGWSNLRLLSAADSTFKYDLASEDAEGNQFSTVSVFTRDADGSVRHSYTGRPRLSEGIDQRGIDLLSPVRHILDLTPRGRGGWHAELDYRTPAEPDAANQSPLRA